ncbi:Atxe2 family lasso peptide isopeptidase [Luteimonas fraxinea]|uniref:Atxe2 family lasso peptide isopeptidase n=1 Tax=Luteimonas fraxinea TaxID=2901869 RepID=A0ABS8UF44_9GAMM|nr:Atxe2 family lasso peptide isopeptidase [Luteimonas fraxinea]MCD9098127.1 Atxe2 family lasso peptide isopeptidase [Luteimonas fraxinea]MCD9125343.1 Atxe2 family lasso peptide isopeptidase [Luteimonas fraxinea]UHH09148.1 Atxe2 family lasso peptide isopeptidase [Luteimonas fraxinea]
MTNDRTRGLTAGVLMCVLAAPSVASAVAPRQLLEIVDIANPVMSPDGSRVAFRTEQASIERNTYDTIWYVQGREDLAPRRVAEGGVPLRDSAGVALPASAVWSPDGRWLYYRALIDARIGIWRAAGDGTGAAPVTDEAGEVQEVRLGDDGRHLHYSVGAAREAVAMAETGEYYRGIRIEPDVPIGQSLFRSGNVEGRMATQRFAEIWFSRRNLMSDTPVRWYAIDLATGLSAPLHDARRADGQTTPSVPDGVEGELWKSIAQPDGEGVALLTRTGETDGQQQRPSIVLSATADARRGQLAKCLAEACTGRSITDVQWRPLLREVLFTSRDPSEGWAQSVHRWHIETGDVLPVVQSQGLVNGGGRDPATGCAVSSNAMACVTADPMQPPRLEWIEIDTGDSRVLFDPNRGLAQDMSRLPAVQRLHWTDEKGRGFSGLLYPARHEDDVAPPLFVTYYNCPGFVRGGVGDEWPLASLAGAGISALCINRLPNYTMDAVERHGEGLEAVRSVIELLAGQGAIDPTRVGMGGLSLGGAITLWTVAESDLIAAASIANPVVSPLYYLIGSMKGDMFFDGLRDMWGLESPEQTPERWQAISPAFKLDRMKAPILFQHSEQEYMYALDYVIPLLRRSQADLYVFPNEPHQKFQPRHKLTAYERNLDWFRFWLQGFEHADPARQGEYDRWRRMREASAAWPR